MPYNGYLSNTYLHNIERLRLELKHYHQAMSSHEEEEEEEEEEGGNDKREKHLK